ncbi:MAG: serine/threonine protein kinase [Planctomycetes bacterium]|nr:serine/threonine protein kinase [Planctomycetota bacterium]
MYELQDVIGRGSMGVVYRARHLATDAVFAVKILPQDLARKASSLERFARESRGASAINHPNVIRVIEVGHDKGHHFIAMEYVQGESLSALLRRERVLRPDLLMGVLRQTASALAAAHDLDIIHRDVKPSNILLMPNGMVKVADFGLAKRTGVDVSVTATGRVIGTPEYVSPEVAMGEEADALSDIYSLGVTFYHLATGRCPFDAPTLAQVLMKQLEHEPPSLDLVAPHLPPVLRAAVHRMMAKNPRARFRSVRELLDFLDGRTTLPAARRRKWPLIVVLVFLLIAAGVGLVLLCRSL